MKLNISICLLNRSLSSTARVTGAMYTYFELCDCQMDCSCIPKDIMSLY